VTVFLVGAGPGDPGLLTVRGAEVLAAADVVIHDRLSGLDLLDLAPATAERISLGNAPDEPAVSQDEITRLLIEHGSTGADVVRLTGGDPFVFACGGEEAHALLEAGIDIEIVPGITSATATPGAAGIPITLGDSTVSFTVISGHEDPTTDTSTDWRAVARLGGTIVILAGVGRWPQISAALLEGGLAPDTPAAAVRWGTRPEQETSRATVATLGDHDLRPPSTIVVGEVAAVDVGWLEKLPLFGKRVVVTRTREQASELAHRLRRGGAAPIEVPTIAVIEPDDGGEALRAAARDLGAYDWVALTSPNGAKRLVAELRDARAFATAKIATIGPGTARVLRDHNLVADLVPDRYVAEGLLEAFPDPPAEGGRVLLPRAADARDVLPDGLRSAGWRVDVVSAYRTVPAEIDDDARAAIAEADIVTFTSSSTVQHFVDLVGIDAVPPVVACIGPITAATARELGLTVAIEATEHTIAGLVAALEAHHR
jgi:uroporphyrinogen III methyltransferase/synthase